MIRRVVDLSLKVAPSRFCEPLLTSEFGQLPAEFEPSGPERIRESNQRVCLVRPYQIGEHSHQCGMDVILGDSLPHSHAETLWIDTTTVLDRVPRSRRWVIRDIAQVPAGEFVREGAVIDLSHLDLSGEHISVGVLKEHAAHLRYGDFVLLRTDWMRKAEGLEESERRRLCPMLSMEASEWLVREKGIVGLATDTVFLLAKIPQDMGVHSHLWENGVVQFDELVNFDQLTAERVFFVGGACLRTTQINSSPARPVALPLDHRSWGTDEVVDMFTPMKVSRGPEPGLPPYDRREPQDLTGELYKRYTTKWLQIGFEPAVEERMLKGGDVRPQRDLGAPIRLFSSHLGTHMLGFSATTLPTPRLIGRGRVLGLTSVGPRQAVSATQMRKAAQRAGVQSGDIVIARTDYCDLYYYRPDYLHWSPGFEPDALAWLVEQGIRMFATDSLALAPGGDYDLEQREAIVDKGVPVVLGASNLWRLEHDHFYVMCSPVPLKGLDASPVRLVAVEIWG